MDLNFKQPNDFATSHILSVAGRLFTYFKIITDMMIK